MDFVFSMSTVLLLMAFVYRFSRIGKLGLAIFMLAVLLNTVAVFWRWYVSGRYPNTNMFEAVTTASWMGALFALAYGILLSENLRLNIYLP